MLSSSITNSGNESFFGYYTIYLQNGKINFENSNISQSKLYGNNILGFYTFKSESKILFSMFFENKDYSTNYPPIFIQSSSTKTTIRIESTNFQNNTEYTLITAYWVTAYLQNCCFANNNISGNYFYASGGKITVDSCFIDEETPKTYGYVTINNRIKDISNNDKYINFIKIKEEDISDLDENPKYINFSILSHNLINISRIV